MEEVEGGNLRVTRDLFLDSLALAHILDDLTTLGGGVDRRTAGHDRPCKKVSKIIYHSVMGEHSQ